MSDIINLLPDSVANQIAAGEVVQRPASVVKELIENSVDASCTSINIVIKDAGRTLIQVIDNGKGMSETDARMAFERHATSKIHNANDLFALSSYGFRGEALASIAAVAEVSLRTKRAIDETGTEIVISDSRVHSQTICTCPSGCNFEVKNLFFNVPARRKFLKSNTTEFRYILSEFQRVALAYPQIAFSLTHNSLEMYNLPATHIRQRIAHLFGKNFNQFLIDIKSETSVAQISGFIGKPECSKKSYGDQFMFVNNRFMKHSGFHRAITDAYSRLIASDDIPVYFIFFQIEPEKIDVNIHPTKTEIKFEDEQVVRQILHATVKEALGKFNIVPSIDFETDTSIDIPVLNRNSIFEAPQINLTPNYNPFDTNSNGGSSTYQRHQAPNEQDNLNNWEKLYDGFENKKIAFPSEDIDQNSKLFANTNQPPVSLMQLKNRFILSAVKSGLMLIDQKRAHERILFERYMAVLTNSSVESQQNMFPEAIELSPDAYGIIASSIDRVNQTGFSISNLGNNTIAVNAYPAHLHNPDIKSLIEKLAQALIDNKNQLYEQIETIALSLAKASAIDYGRVLRNEEMTELVDQLFACQSHNHTADGKAIMSIIEMNEIEKRFK